MWTLWRQFSESALFYRVLNGRDTLSSKHKYTTNGCPLHTDASKNRSDANTVKNIKKTHSMGVIDVNCIYSVAGYRSSIIQAQTDIWPLKKWLNTHKMILELVGMYSFWAATRMTNLFIPGYIRRGISSKYNPQTLSTGHPQHYKGGSEGNLLSCVNAYPRGNLRNY